MKEPRPFSADYPKGGIADDAGRLQFDIDGRPLVADPERIVGRRVVGGADEALSPAEFDEIAKAATGESTLLVPPSQMQRRGSLGEVVVNRYSKMPKLVRLSNTLEPHQLEKVYGHEIGHVIDQAAGEISTKGIVKELEGVFDTLLTSREKEKKRTGPQHIGYKADDVPRELMAEAIRAYMKDPNYLKTVAPKTAAAIRGHVNSHPTLSKIIQFNSLAAGAVGAGLLGSEGEP